MFNIIKYKRMQFKRKEPSPHKLDDGVFVLNLVDG